MTCPTFKKIKNINIDFKLAEMHRFIESKEISYTYEGVRLVYLGERSNLLIEKTILDFLDSIINRDLKRLQIVHRESKDQMVIEEDILNNYLTIIEDIRSDIKIWEGE